MRPIAVASGVGVIVIAIAGSAWWWQVSGTPRIAAKSIATNAESDAVASPQSPKHEPSKSSPSPEEIRGAESTNQIKNRSRDSSSVNTMSESVSQQTKERYRLLAFEKDPVAKREIRLQISRLHHTTESIEFLVQSYAGADADTKLQVQSIFAQINPVGLQNELKLIAENTRDEVLFLSIVYSLRNSPDVSSKEAMLFLAGNNYITTSRDGSFSNQASVGLYRVFLDSVKSGDLYWLRIANDSGQLNVLQRRMVADAITKLMENAHLANR